MRPTFYQAELTEVTGDVLVHVYGKKLGSQLTMEERMGDENATCPDCGQNKWFIYPKESSIVRESGKPYIECLNCGHTTHL